jgi:hypothetical protein
MEQTAERQTNPLRPSGHLRQKHAKHVPQIRLIKVRKFKLVCVGFGGG